MNRTHGDYLKRMIEFGIDSSEKAEAALSVLARIAPETMTQEQVAARWPRVLAAMICESLGYFTPRSAANALLAHKLRRPFGCEYYCFSAGFERDGWPSDQAVYSSKIKAVNEQKIRHATGCRQDKSKYDECAGCKQYRYCHASDPSIRCHEFIEKPREHRGCRHQPSGYMRDYQYALKLVRDMAGGAANPPALLASWF